jgi:small subunit ribosomal protein S20
MANIKSAKKRARTNEENRQLNVQRRSDIKTATKKVLAALEVNDVNLAQELLRQAESKIARARVKGVLKQNTASRKVSRLAKKVATATKASA